MTIPNDVEIDYSNKIISLDTNGKKTYTAKQIYDWLADLAKYDDEKLKREKLIKVLKEL